MNELISGRGELFNERDLVLDLRLRLTEPMLALLATERNEGGRFEASVDIMVQCRHEKPAYGIDSCINY